VESTVGKGCVFWIELDLISAAQTAAQALEPAPLLQSGFIRYRTKPIKVNEFMETLDVALKFAQAELAHAAREEQA
jgi:hypothetical protein